MIYHMVIQDSRRFQRDLLFIESDKTWAQYGREDVHGVRVSGQITETAWILRANNTDLKPWEC